MINDFPKTDDYLINALFDQRVRNRVLDLNAQKELVDSHRPPTQVDIDRFILTSDDPDVIETRQTILSLREQLAQHESWLDEYVRAALHSPANDDERQAARTRFNAQKKLLVESLHSLGVLAADRDEQAVVEWVNRFQENLPSINTKAATNSLKDMRKWLQEKHPEAGIKSRGTIPIEWQQKYYDAHK